MADRQQLVSALKKADQLYKETGDEKHREAAKKFDAAIRSSQTQTSGATATAQSTESRDERLERERAAVADGITLSPFGIDTGIELPQGATEFLAGAGRRLSQIGTLGAHEGDAKANELLDDSGYATAGGVAADVAAMAPLGAPASLGKAALQGAGYAAATTSGDVKDRAAAAAAGGIGGGVGYGATKAVSRALSPKLDPRAMELERRGVRVTPGRLAGQTGTRIEDMSTSAPLMGDATIRRQVDMVEDYNRVVLNEVLEPLRRGTARAASETVEQADAVAPGTSVATTRGGAVGRPNAPRTEVGRPAGWIEGEWSYVREGAEEGAQRAGFEVPTINKVGREGIDQVSEVVSKAYDDVLDQIGAVQLDDTFTRESRRLLQMSEQMDESAQRKFKSAYDNLMRRFNNETSSALGFNYKRAESSLRKAYKKAYDQGDSELGNALRSLFKATRDTARRQHPELIERLDDVDEAYAKLSEVQKAANYTGAREGLFTPSHHLAAIKKATPDRLYARGRGFDQRAVESAKEVMTQSVPDSGTAGRGMLTAMSTGFMSPLIPAGLAAGAVVNSRAGQNVMRAAMLNRPQAARQAGDVLEILAPYLAKGGTAAGINQP